MSAVFRLRAGLCNTIPDPWIRSRVTPGTQQFTGNISGWPFAPAIYTYLALSPVSGSRRNVTGDGGVHQLALDTTEVLCLLACLLACVCVLVCLCLLRVLACIHLVLFDVVPLRRTLCLVTAVLSKHAPKVMRNEMASVAQACFSDAVRRTAVYHHYQRHFASIE
ncbi:hypothetical protein GGS24DRAFT_500401 [Hypoxylon argillaceum]|nr:hypothetical protein GGS24DRAFT_500401 [Hypoxylon argillaceum]